MRIAVVLSDPPPSVHRAGADRLRGLAERFADRGHDVTVYCTAWWDFDVPTFRRERDGVTYLAVTVTESVGSFLARVPGIVASGRPDVVVVSPAPPPTVLAAQAGATLARAPLVCDWFGDESDSRLVGPAVRLPRQIVTPSEMQRTRVRSFGATEESTTVVPQSIDFPLVEETTPGEESDVVYARRLDDDANLESLLLGLAELRNREDWTATVIGDGPERPSYERQAENLGIGDRVRFTGSLPRDERVARYRGTHTFVQTARREAFAEELLWALACGCVGVVEYQSDSSAHELIERRHRGIRVTDSESLEAGIVDAWRHPFRDIDDSFRRFDHAVVVGDYLEVFRECGADAR